MLQKHKTAKFWTFFAIFFGWENQMRPNGMNKIAAKHLKMIFTQLLKTIKTEVNYHSLMYMTSMATIDGLKCNRK